MEFRELTARLTAILILLGLPGVILGYQFWLRPELSAHRVIDIDAAVPESGGFSISAIQLDVDETVTLRFSSVDVTHGIAIGPGVGVDVGYIDPGYTEELTLSFDTPGTYTFYCTIWCSPNHWRMRGVITVHDPENPGSIPEARPDPVIVALQEEGVDIDAELTNYEPVTGVQPSAIRGAAAVDNLSVPAQLHDQEWKRRHTPAEALEMLDHENNDVALQVLVDVIAYLWVDEYSGSQASNIANLYNQNCAACHGQTGAGDGPAAPSTAVEPASFSDPTYMFMMRGDVLYAKIRRGGMGTDMPNFGTLFTQQETWALVDYLWSLLFSQNR